MYCANTFSKYSDRPLPHFKGSDSSYPLLYSVPNKNLLLLAYHRIHIKKCAKRGMSGSPPAVHTQNFDLLGENEFFKYPNFLKVISKKSAVHI
jgi:hypothetical protein